MEYKIKHDLEDWGVVQAYVVKRASIVIDKDRNFFAAIVTWAFIAALAFYYFKNVNFDGSTALMFGSIFALLLFQYAFRMRRIRKLYTPSPDGSFLAEYIYRFTEQGYDIESEYMRSHSLWNSVLEVVELDKHILIFIDSFTAHVLPKRLIHNTAELLTFIKSYIGPEKIKSALSAPQGKPARE